MPHQGRAHERADDGLPQFRFALRAPRRALLSRCAALMTQALARAHPPRAHPPHRSRKGFLITDWVRVLRALAPISWRPWRRMPTWCSRASASTRRCGGRISYASDGRERRPGEARGESLYSAARLRQLWPSHFPTTATAEPFEHDPKKLAEKVYGGRMGNTQPRPSRFADTASCRKPAATTRRRSRTIVASRSSRCCNGSSIRPTCWNAPPRVS